MHEYFHTRFGFCLWDAGALAVLALIVVVLAVHIVRQNKRERDFVDELTAQMAERAVERGKKEDKP